MINSHLETYIPTVEGRVDPDLASTVTYGLTVKTVFMEYNLIRVRVIVKEEVLVGTYCHFPCSTFNSDGDADMEKEIKAAA